MQPKNNVRKTPSSAPALTILLVVITGSLTPIHQAIPWPLIPCLLPQCHVRIIVRLRMALDILRRLKAGRITRHHLLSFPLIPPDIVELHEGREAERIKLDVDPVVRDAEVEDHGHGLLADDALADVAVGLDGARIEAHHLLVADGPGDEGVLVRAQFILEGVFLVGDVVVPVVVQGRGGADGLLERPAGVSVDEGEAVVGAVCSLVSSRLHLRRIDRPTFACIRSLGTTRCRMGQPVLHLASSNRLKSHGKNT